MSHSQVEIYVRSSALGSVGIHWRNICKPEQPNEDPVVLKKLIIAEDDGKMVTISSLINDNKPSLILARYENKVLLEVTGLDAAEARSQKMGRKISEVFLWVGDASVEVESQLIKLAACALLSFWDKESTFLATIRSAIDFDGLDSFRVNTQEIEQLYNNAANDLDSFLSEVSAIKIESSESVWLTPKKIDIESNLYTLLKEISQTALPETDQPVVIVAEFKKEGTEQQLVYKGNVWKKKTSLPTTEPVSPEPGLLEPASTTETALPSKSRIKKMIQIILILPRLVWLAIGVIPHKPKSPTPTPTPTPTPGLSPVSTDNHPKSAQTQSPDA